MGLGSIKFMGGLNDLNGLFQPKCFYDSMCMVPSTEGENYIEAQQGDLPGITVEDGDLL